MAYFGEFSTLTHVLLGLGVIISFWVYISMKKRKFNLPPGPRGLPIVGYLPFLGTQPILELQKLSKKYGGIFSVYLGRTHVVLVADVAVAKQLLNKASVSDRPDGLFLLLPGGGGFAELSGEDWIEQRRYTIAEMKNLGFGRSHWEKLVEAEVLDFLDILVKLQGQPGDIYKDLSASVSNNVLSLVTSRSLPAGHPNRNILDQGVESFELLYGQSGLIANYPKIFNFLAEIGLIKGGQMLKDMMKLNKYVREEIEELKHEKDGNTYIHKYTAEIEKNKRLNLGNSFNDTNLIGNTQALIMAGSDTTKVSVLWLFLAMASYPDIQDKVQEEIDAELEKDGKADWMDRNKLPYCHATIMEGQRWRTVVPLNVQHRTSEDIEINGYDIPKKTIIITIITAFHNDTRYWKDPDAFQPERFLSEDRKSVIKEPEAFMPFSYGKRLCPGKTVALIEIFHYFVSTMQRFRILPASDSIKPDLEGCPGLTLQPKHQSLRFVPR